MTVSAFTQEMIHKIDSNESMAYTIMFTLDSYNRPLTSVQVLDVRF